MNPSQTGSCIRSRSELLHLKHAMSSKLLVGFVVGSLSLVGCGRSSVPTATESSAKPAVGVQTARALNAPFTFTVNGNAVTVTIDRAQRFPSSTDEPVQVVCANLGVSGIVDRSQAQGVWKQGARSTTVALPKTATGLDLCAINFSARTGKQAAAFFSAQAKTKYLLDQKTTK
jgi:hypothetical protein